MAELFQLASLGLPAENPFATLLERFPDIELRKYTDGEYLARESEVGREIFLVLKGGYVVEFDRGLLEGGPGHALADVVSEPVKPTFVGEMAYFDGGPRCASVRASGALYALVLHPEQMEIILAEYPFFTRILCDQLAVRLEEANAIIREYHQSYTLHAELVSKKTGECIFEQEEKADILFQLIDGTVILEGPLGMRTVASGDLVGGFLEPGPYFQEKRHAWRATADGQVLLVAIYEDSRLAVIRRYPEVLLNLIQNTEMA